MQMECKEQAEQLVSGRVAAGGEFMLAAWAM
jgi:hypothetical protein